MISDIEAILFHAGGVVDIDKLKKYFNVSENEIIENINILNDEYKSRNHGIEILLMNNKCLMRTKKEKSELISEFFDKKITKLSPQILEVLAIILYKQPITRMEVDDIRGGVKSDKHINKLIECGFVKELGRKEVLGKPILFGTTEEFIKNFGVLGIDFPYLDDIILE